MNTSPFEPLRALQLPLVLPKTLPANWSLKSVQPEPDEYGGGYQIHWTSPNGSLTLLAASGGIGDRLPGDESVPFQQPTFGACTIEVEGTQLATEWMSEMINGLPAYSLVGEGVSREEFISVACSLDYLKL